ncbi:hypothetical protein N7478_010838 [Penicillium angulare]|uniref:uncharacterized protein n=1 Tax=Penicillium angulare TaxID=116970 RepID=UPI002541D158|nr:uncharacterized protein N7478_010838 [Penicillium angulare]KAJ5263233.1 hypothetical protein N7478_010838 [Penicillium angulare]
MKIFSLQLDDGGRVSGRVSLPPAAPGKGHRPLLVCFHGGSYDSEYFDATPEYSITQISDALGIPVVSIDRPGYGDTTQPAIPQGETTTYAQVQGKYINEQILPRLWQEYGTQSEATAIVLLSHSIGAMMATISAACCAGTTKYPLAGLITSGIGAETNPIVAQQFKSIVTPGQEFMTFDPAIKDVSMLQLPHKQLADPAITEFTANLNRPTPIGEFIDINNTWLSYWKKYSQVIDVPLLYGISEFDELWTSTPEIMEEYRDAFPSCPWIESSIITQAPHCIELSYQRRGWQAKCCGFALECATWYALTRRD